MPKGEKGFTKGHTVPDEIREKIRVSKVGLKMSQATKEKMRLAKLGKKYKPMSEEGKRNIRKSLIGRKQSKATIEKRNESRRGYRHSVETRRRMSEAQKGDKAFNWKGGLTTINERVRKSLEYRLWRESVFKRDSYTCVWCKKVGGVLNADHIKPFALYPELRFAVDNGRTLCVPCHKTTDTYGGKIIKIRLTNG